MRKFLILSLIFFITDSLASGIASNTNSAPCTNNTLETYSGNSNLSADWQPNEIQLRWYNGNTLLNVQSSANTCVYDSTLTIPQTAPTRTGYTFDGWTVRPEMDFAATIPTNVVGTNRWAIGLYNDTNSCWYATNSGSAYEVNCDSDTTYINELQTHEWKVSFSHGNLYGMSRCSATSGTYAQPGTPVIGSGQYCWCKATGYKPSGSNIVNSPLSTLSWIFALNRVSVVDCDQRCAVRCAYYTKFESDFRTALFVPASN